MKRIFAFPAIFLSILAVYSAVFINQVIPGNMQFLDQPDLTVIFDPGARHGAEHAARIYPEIKRKTETLFGWTYSQKPMIVIINDREKFLQMADHAITVAYAVPAKNLIVMDYTMVTARPFSMETTFIHEFCHLLLHQYIPEIPRWLDEGLCQWASGGIDEIIYNRKQSELNRASVTGHFIPFDNLSSDFPRSESGRILAYEQSKSIITYLVRQFGEKKLIDLLELMASGDSAKEAFPKIFKTEFAQVERSWKDSILKDYNWLTYISNHLYEILFVAGALLTVIAFLKLVWKKQRYKDEEDDE